MGKEDFGAKILAMQKSVLSDEQSERSGIYAPRASHNGLLFSMATIVRYRKGKVCVTSIKVNQTPQIGRPKKWFSGYRFGGHPRLVSPHWTGRSLLKLCQAITKFQQNKLWRWGHEFPYGLNLCTGFITRSWSQSQSVLENRTGGAIRQALIPLFQCYSGTFLTHPKRKFPFGSFFAVVKFTVLPRHFYLLPFFPFPQKNHAPFTVFFRSMVAKMHFKWIYWKNER